MIIVDVGTWPMIGLEDNVANGATGVAEELTPEFEWGVAEVNNFK